jgi:hypothetical protein
MGLGLLLLSLAVGCTPARAPESACAPLPVVPREPTHADLTGAVVFRNYVALTNVEPFAHHYVASYEGASGSLPMIATWYDANGTLQLSGGGDLGQTLRPPPSEVGGITRALEGELARRCPDVRFRLSYAGGFRRLRVTSFVPTDLRAGRERAGWLSKSELLADATLKNTVGVGYHHSNVIVYSGYGLIRAPEDVRWVELERQDTRGRELRFARNFDERVLAAARSREAGLPGPRLADLPVDEPDALVFAGHDARVHLVVTLGSSAAGAQVRAVVPLSVHDAVFGAKAVSKTQATLGTTRYEVHATLVPEKTFAPEPERMQRDYRGMLTVRVLDARGVAFERGFATSGDVIVEGDEAAVSYAWMIPGGTAPSQDDELRRGKFRSSAGEDVGVSVDMQLKERAPR